MNLQINEELIPGTILNRKDMGDVTGLEFLNKIFYISDGVMLTQIREISGIDGSTLQNWTKRGWVANARLKRYNIDQVAHILLINMLRSCMQLEHIASLIQYINGDLEDESDDIIRDSVLYDYVCRILDRVAEKGSCSLSGVGDEVRRVTADYVEPFAGAGERLGYALEVIVVTYYSALVKRHATKLLEELLEK